MPTPQEEYNNFCRNTPVNTQNLYSGQTPQNIEKELIQELSPKSLLDIGCGNGDRMFPFYESLNIDFYGIEKFQEIVNNSSDKYKNKIFNLDIGSENFIEEFRNISKIESYDLIVLFGTINGFIDEKLRNNAWKNISSLINKNNKLLFNTLISANNLTEEWFRNNKSGKIEKLYNFLPPQYFYTEYEIKTILSDNNLIIEKYKDANINNNSATLRYYIAKRKD